MTEKDIEELLQGSVKNNRIISYARRQAIKENMDSATVEKLLKSDKDFVVKYARRFIADDLQEFYSQLQDILEEEDSKMKEQKIDDLLFDFRIRIPDIIELLE